MSFTSKPVTRHGREELTGMLKATQAMSVQATGNTNVNRNTGHKCTGNSAQATLHRELNIHVNFLIIKI
jgi:hypothetical protein